MARDSSKPSRTGDLRAAIERSGFDWRSALFSRGFGWGVVIWSIFVLVTGLTAIWARQHPLVAVGRVMHATRTVSTAFEVEDGLKTEAARDAARQRSPRIYVANDAVLEGLHQSISNLPMALADVANIDGVEAGLRAQYGLTPALLAAIQRYGAGGGGASGGAEGAAVSAEWHAASDELDRILRRSPILDSQTYQVEVTAQNERMELRSAAKAEPMQVPTRMALNADGQDLSDEMRRLASQAGFEGAAIAAIANRLSLQAVPTYTFDKEATEASQAEAAAAIPAQVIRYPERDVIFHRGDVLSPEQLKLWHAATEAESAADSWLQTFLRAIGLFGAVGAVGLALAGYTVMFCPRIRANPARLAAVAGLLAAAVVVSALATVAQPGLIALTAVAPTLFAAIILIVAYDQRMALAFGVLLGLIVAAALDLPVTMYALIVAGVGSAVWRLKEIRDRHTLIVAGVLNAAVLALGMFVVGLVDLPVGRAALMQTLSDAALCGFGGLMVAGVAVFVLPVVERAFDITTGLTLIELRDPKQPLLRQLQQRAPGTYNHSLTVASLAEAAAESIKADGLLAYVGALYHDIGKMNKPDYFVENQPPGINRHDRLSPAMSLLVIVGHVKDGMELAREFRLPRQLHHFIESHHGTTLVEYFFHRARRQADALQTGDEPEEIEYRYPGPRPATKEAAILMLCDAVESATRAMPDPTPSRIEAMVQDIATRRLMDGQFDHCDLTLRELNTLSEAITRALAAIYHGRIAYPTSVKETAPRQVDQPTAGHEPPGSGPAPETSTAIRQGPSAELVSRAS